MTEQEFQNKSDKGQVNFLPPIPQTQPPPQPTSNLEEFIPLLQLLRLPRRHLTTPPSFTPKTYAEQIQFVDDGDTQKLFIYLNGAWYFVELTLFD